MKRSIYALLLALAACHSKPPPDSRICEAVAPDDAINRSMSTSCIHRQAYKLASAPGSTGTIADAVMHACEDTLPMSAGIDQGLAHNGSISMKEYLETFTEKMRKEAEYRVVQARAGHCEGL